MPIKCSTFCINNCKHYIAATAAADDSDPLFVEGKLFLCIHIANPLSIGQELELELLFVRELLPCASYS